VWWVCDGIFDDNEFQQRYKHKSSMKKVEKKKLSTLCFLLGCEVTKFCIKAILYPNYSLFVV